MAKKKSKSFDVDQFGAAMAMSAIQGDKNAAAIGQGKFIALGIPIPLGLQYLIDASSLPTGLIYQITGARGSRKTTFALELMRLAAKRNGYGDFVLTEGKASPSLIPSVCGYPGEPDYRAVNPINCYSMDEWQQVAAKLVRRAKESVEEGLNVTHPRTGEVISIPPGGHGPYVLIVDSLVAQLTSSQAEKVSAEGGQPRGYATHVKALSDFIKALTPAVSNQPFIGAFINHCTETQENMYSKIEVKEKGGTTLAYNTSLIVTLRGTTPQIKMLDLPNVVPESTQTFVNFGINKSSFGADTQRAKVRIDQWREITEQGEVRQRTRFCWGALLTAVVMEHCYAPKSSANQMVRIPKEKATDKLRKRYREMFFDVAPIQVVANRNDQYICKKYSEEVMDGEELGNHLDSDPEFVKVFRQAFGINTYPEWPRRVTYMDAAKQLREKLDFEAVQFFTS